MKHIAFLTLFIILSNITFSQTKYDNRLLVKYDKEMLEKIAIEQPGRLNWLNYHISHMYEILTKDNLKINKLDTLKLFDAKTKKIINGRIGNIDPETFNPFLYNIKESSKEDKYYLIPGTNKVVHVFPTQKIINDYNNRQK